MSWTDDVHLTPNKAMALASRLREEWDLPWFDVAWEVETFDAQAHILWPDIELNPVISFTGWGCTLETLAHELAHLVEGPDAPTHGADFHFLKRLVAHQLQEYLRES